MGEKAIAQSAEYSCKYARYVLKGRFELGEKAIAQSAEYSCKYARYVLKGRFELGEPAMLKNRNVWGDYQTFLKGLK